MGHRYVTFTSREKTPKGKQTLGRKKVIFSAAFGPLPISLVLLLIFTL
jgi:hypothetical protein